MYVCGEGGEAASRSVQRTCGARLYHREKVRCDFLCVCVGGGFSASRYPLISWFSRPLQCASAVLSSADAFPPPPPPTWDVQCVAKCCEKFMNGTGRVGQRFGEFYSEVSWLPQWEGGRFR